MPVRFTPRVGWFSYHSPRRGGRSVGGQLLVALFCTAVVVAFLVAAVTK